MDTSPQDSSPTQGSEVFTRDVYSPDRGEADKFVFHTEYSSVPTVDSPKGAPRSIRTVRRKESFDEENKNQEQEEGDEVLLSPAVQNKQTASSAAKGLKEKLAKLRNLSARTRRSTSASSSRNKSSQNLPVAASNAEEHESSPVSPATPLTPHRQDAE